MNFFLLQESNIFLMGTTPPNPNKIMSTMAEGKGATSWRVI